MKKQLNNRILVLSTLLIPMTFWAAGCSSGNTEGEVSDSSETPADGDVVQATTDAAPKTEGSAPTTDEPKGDAAPTAYKAAEAVAVPSAPLEKAGTALNGYAFVRAGENNWEALSQKIFGNTEQVENLKKWNAGKPLRPGFMVYYASPNRAGDPTLKSFYEEAGTPPEPYTVKRGDSLSSIAKGHFGHIGSWKEISAANPDLKAPDQLVVGSTIQLPPGGQAGGGSTTVANGNENGNSGTSAQSEPSNKGGIARNTAGQAESGNGGDSAPSSRTVASTPEQSANNGGTTVASQTVPPAADTAAENRQPASPSEAPPGLIGKLKVALSGRNGMAAGGVAVALAGLGLFMRMRSRRLA